MVNCFTANRIFKFSTGLFLFIMTILAMIISPSVAQAGEWNTYQVTASNGSNANIDVDIDSNGTLHAVYERNGNIYYKSGLGNEELVAPGRRPAVATGPDGIPQVVFIGLSGGNYYTTRAGGVWQTPINLSQGSSEIDIDVDSNNRAHIVLVADMLGDHYVDIVYVNNTGGAFSAEVIWNGWYWYDGGGRTGRYYDNPRVRVDSTGVYHIIASHHAVDGAPGWTEHAYYVVYKTSAGGGIESSSPYRGNVEVVLPYNALAFASDNDARIIYSQNGTVYYASPGSGSWTETSLGALSQPAINSADVNIGLAYVSDSNVMYMVDSGTGFGSPLIIDAGFSPVVALGSTFIYYLKSDGSYDQVFLKTDTTLESAPSVTQDPENQAITYGNNAVFTAGASGMPAPDVQWQMSTDGGLTFENIEGETTSTLTIIRPPVTFSGRQFRAVFTNSLGSDTTAAATLTVDPANVTPVITVKDKVYDGTTDAEIDSQTLTGVIGSDDVSLTGGTASFSDKNSGNGKTVIITGFSLSGIDAVNYRLSSNSVTVVANILPAILNPEITVNDKTYDGTTAAEIISRSLTGIIGDDDVILSGGTAFFADKNAGSGKIVEISGLTLSGDDSVNYVLSSGSYTTTADITPLAITVTAVSDSKVYDGTTVSTGIPLVSRDLCLGDTPDFSQRFNTKHVGTGKQLIPYGQVNDGNGGANYQITFIENSDGVITPRPVTIKATGAVKIYDGTIASLASPVITSGSLAEGDSAEFYQTYADRNVGTGKMLTPAGSVDDGNNGLNYDLTFESVSDGVITPRLITVTSTPDIKTYDGTIASTAIPALTSGTLAEGDTPDFSQSFDSPDAGTGKLLTPAGSVNDGNGGLNYQITFIATNSGQINPLPIAVRADTQTKVYGEVDPEFTYQVIEGTLVNGDAFTGELDREPGEDVGSYRINQGTLALNANYILSFTGSDLRVLARPIVISADEKSKVYGDTDPELTYSISSGSLAFSDSVTGVLTRDPGENVGNYSINRGTLSVNENYELTFVGATFRVMPRPVTVKADPQTKVYGDADPELTYTITEGSLVNGDTFTGSLTRVPGENCGEYRIGLGSLSLGSNYILNFTEEYLTITPRAITVTAVTSIKIYDGTTSSSQIPEITSGSLAFDDTAMFIQTFDTKDVGTNKTLTPSGRVNDGNNGNNYTYTFISIHTGVINKATPIIIWSNPDDISYGTPLSDTQLNATASVPGNFIYNPSAGTILNPGIYTLNVNFTPEDEENYNSADKEVTIEVNKALPQIVLTSSLNPSLTGQLIMFTVTLSSPVGNPSGTVTFKDGNTILGIQPLNHTGQAIFTINTLTAGSHSITVEYSGDQYFSSINSTALNQVVTSPNTGGMVPAPIFRTVSLIGITSPLKLLIDDSGNIQETAQIQSLDGKVIIGIGAGTRLQNSNGTAITSLSISPINSLLSPPPGNVLIYACKFGPEGARFNPALTITIRYDLSSLPAGVHEKDLYIAYFDGEKWEMLDSKIDTVNKTVSAGIAHFSIYCVLGKISSPLEPSPSIMPAPSPSQDPVVSPAQTITPRPQPEAMQNTPTASTSASAGGSQSSAPVSTAEATQGKPASTSNLPMIIGIIAVMVAILLVLIIILRRAKTR